MPGRSRSRGLGASRPTTRRTVDGIVGFRRSWERQSPPWHRDGATMRARRVSRRGEGGGAAVAAAVGTGTGTGAWTGRRGGRGKPGGRDAHVRPPPRRRSPKGRYHRGDPIIAAIRCAPVANCFAAAQRGRVACRGGVGGGVRNAPASRAHAGNLGDLWAPRFGDETSQSFFLRCTTSPRARSGSKKFPDGKKTFRTFVRLTLIRHRFFFFFVRTALKVD